MSDSELRYTFTCPSCSGNFSILLERVPPVQARFRCPHCQKPMDFPSRDEARVYASLQAQATAKGSEGPSPAASAPADGSEGDGAGEGRAAEKRFAVDKKGFERDVYDRRAVRDLIRTGELDESDRIRIDDGEFVTASSVADLKPLFDLKKTSSVTPPRRCRSHTDRNAYFVCQDTGRPLCEDCAEEKKFGGTSIRVCAHCGGGAQELAAGS